MTEIEKMFENAGIEKEFEKPAECSKNPYITCNGCMLYDDKKGKCNNRKDYPPFTAEKQLEIENVILQNKKNYNKWIEYSINVYGEWVIRFVRTDKFAPYIALEKTRAEAFANVINYFWQSLTDQEKEEIRNILNA